ncbi:hypothetical protein RLIN73S_05141 [Rhodanobacter lindaniclasticus]
MTMHASSFQWPSFPRKRARGGMDAVADAEGGPKGDRRKRSQSIRLRRRESLDSRFRGNDGGKGAQWLTGAHP